MSSASHVSSRSGRFLNFANVVNPAAGGKAGLGNGLGVGASGRKPALVCAVHGPVLLPSQSTGRGRAVGWLMMASIFQTSSEENCHASKILHPHHYKLRITQTARHIVIIRNRSNKQPRKLQPIINCISGKEHSRCDVSLLTRHGMQIDKIR
jgi:hypothetical protein